MNKVGAYVVHWRQDQKVWGSIPTIGHICRSVGQTSCHAASVGLAVMGTWWNKNGMVVIGSSRRKCAELSPQDMRLQKCASVPGV